MLAHILNAFSRYERRHQVRANVLDISYEHYEALMREYPDLFGPEQKVTLGFHICLHSNREQPHPSVRRLPAVNDVIEIQQCQVKA